MSTSFLQDLNMDKFSYGMYKLYSILSDHLFTVLFKFALKKIQPLVLSFFFFLIRQLRSYLLIGSSVRVQLQLAMYRYRVRLRDV